MSFPLLSVVTKLSLGRRGGKRCGRRDGGEQRDGGERRDALRCFCIRQENFRTREKRVLSRSMGGVRRGRRRREREVITVGIVDD